MARAFHRCVKVSAQRWLLLGAHGLSSRAEIADEVHGWLWGNDTQLMALAGLLSCHPWAMLLFAIVSTLLDLVISLVPRFQRDTLVATECEHKAQVMRVVVSLHWLRLYVAWLKPYELTTSAPGA